MNWTENQLRDYYKSLKGSAAPAPVVTKRCANKWEAAYAEELENEKRAGLIRNWWFEGVKFRLADGCWFLPDFLVEQFSGKFELHEIKGYWKDDALVKAKVMAEVFPFPLLAIRKKRVSEGGGWKMIRRFEKR